MNGLPSALLSSAVVAFLPSATALRVVREAFPALPESLRGIGRRDHVALTYDDGPDRHSTPAFLELLSRQDTRATFFLLGSHVGPDRTLVAEMASQGHELAVHGWDHRCTVAKRPGRLLDEIRRTRDLLEDIGQRHVRYYRPPYGVSTTESIWAARRSGLRTVLWTAWGRDWEHRATPQSIAGTVRHQLRTGGTVLLHDTDRTSAPGSWWRTLSASETLLPEWRASGVHVGPLSEHFVDDPFLADDAA